MIYVREIIYTRHNNTTEQMDNNDTDQETAEEYDAILEAVIKKYEAMEETPLRNKLIDRLTELSIELGIDIENI